MNDPRITLRDTASLSRRAVLCGAGAAAVAATVAGCSNEGRGVQPQPTESGLEMPASLERRSLDGVHLSEVAQVPPAFTKIPYPGYQSVADVPGAGGKVSGLSIIWGTAAAPLENNQWHQAVNKALGADLEVANIPAQAFGTKLVTAIASGDIPDITTNEPTNRGRAARKYLPQGMFYDLREFLGGDKVKQYPNLALVPEYAWKSSRVQGALYGIPCYRNRTVGGTTAFRQDWVEKGGGGAAPTNADELFAWLQALQAGGGKGTYALGTMPQVYMVCGTQMFRAPNNWRLNDDGTLTKDLETDEFKESLAFANKIWEAGLVHPDVLTLTPNASQAQDYFYSGRIGSCIGNLDQYFGGGYFGKLAQRSPEAKGDVLVPPGADGGKGMVPPDAGYYCMLSIPTSIKSKDRVAELLRIIDFMAAPMGSKEYYLTQYGVEGHNFAMTDGAPVVTTGSKVEGERGWQGMLNAFAFGFYYPGAPDDALRAQGIAERMVECFVDDPTLGLDSETSFSKGDTLQGIVDEYVNAIVTSRRPLGDLDEMRTRWRESGGDQVRKEFEQALTLAK